MEYFAPIVADNKGIKIHGKFGPPLMIDPPFDILC